MLGLLSQLPRLKILRRDEANMRSAQLDLATLKKKTIIVDETLGLQRGSFSNMPFILGNKLKAQ